MRKQREEGAIKVVKVETGWITVKRSTKQRHQERDERSAKSGGGYFETIHIVVKMDS